MMDQTTLLIGASVAAGAHMVLFGVAAGLAWMYFKRCRKLKGQLAQHEIPDDQGGDDRPEGEDSRRSESNNTDEYRRSRDGNRHRESMARRTRRERRHQRDRERRRRDDSSPYPEGTSNDETPGEERREEIRMSRLSRHDTKRDPRDVRGSAAI